MLVSSVQAVVACYATAPRVCTSVLFIANCEFFFRLEHQIIGVGLHVGSTVTGLECSSCCHHEPSPVYLKPVRKLLTANDISLPASVLEEANQAVVNYSISRMQQAEPKLQKGSTQ